MREVDEGDVYIDSSGRSLGISTPSINRWHRSKIVDSARGFGLDDILNKDHGAYTSPVRIVVGVGSPMHSFDKGRKEGWHLAGWVAPMFADKSHSRSWCSNCLMSWVPRLSKTNVRASGYVLCPHSGSGQACCSPD